MDFRNFSPCFLIAMPELNDPHFHKTVVLLSDYHSDGAVGFIINRRSELEIGTSVILSEGSINPAYNNVRLWFGGPVDPHKLWILYDNVAYDDQHGIEITTGVSLAQDIKLLLNHEKVLRSLQLRVINGCASWVASQLEAEIAASMWITAPLSKDLLFEPDTNKIWDKAIQRLGIDVNTLMAPQSHFLN